MERFSRSTSARRTKAAISISSKARRPRRSLRFTKKEAAMQPMVRVCVLALLLVPAQTTKGFAPVARIDALPYVSEKGRGAYQEFLGMPTPRAFAIAPNGAWGRAARFGAGPRRDVAEDALARCNQRGEGQCRM